MYVKPQIFALGFLLLAMLYACALPYSGLVLDAKTNVPIKNVVVVRSWNREIATAGGGVTTGGWIKKTLSDEHGEFTVPGAFYFPGIPFLSGVWEKPLCFFKPGYKVYFSNKKDPRVSLEKIPTFIANRKRELEEADNWFWGREIWMESDFIDHAENLIEYKRKVQLNWGKYHRYCERCIPDMKDISNIRYETLKVRTAVCQEEDPNKVSSLIDGLADRDELVRLLSAKKLGEYCIEDEINLIKLEKFAALQIKAWDGSNIQVVKIPVAYLGIIGAPVVKPLIQALSNKNFNVRIAAIRALAGTRDAAALDALVRQFNEQDQYIEVTETFEDMLEKVRAGASGYSISVSDIKGRVVKKFRPSASGFDQSNTTPEEMAAMRLDIAEALKYFNQPMAMEVLLTALDDHDVSVKREAALSLGYAGEPDAIPALIKALKNEGSIPSYSTILLALKMFGNSATEPLIDILLKSEAWQARACAAEALGYIKDPRAADALIIAAADANQPILGYVLGALINLRDPKARPIFEQHARSDNKLIKELSIKGLSGIESLSKAEVFQPSPEIKNTSSNISLEFLNALLFDIGNLPVEQTAERIRAVWENDNYEVRKLSDDLFLKRGPSLLHPLLFLLNDSDPYIRWHSIWMIARLQCVEAVQYLIPFLQDEASEVRWMTITALGCLGSLIAAESLSMALNEEDQGIRSHTQRSLNFIIEQEKEKDSAPW